MSRSAPTGGASTGAGKTAFAGVFVLLMAIVLVLIVRARPGPEPFDPRSGASDGTRGLVLLLEDAGAEVSITRDAPEPGDGSRLLVIADLLDDEQRSAALDFVEAGGVAIVADPDSTLHGGPGLDGGSEAIGSSGLPEDRGSVDQEANIRRSECTIAALQALRGLYVRDGVLYPVGPSEPQCFGRDGTSFVIVREIGDGIVVGLGDNGIFTNRDLRRADNAGLATALLAPDDGARVALLLGSDANPSPAGVGTGDETLVDLVPSWIWMGLALGGLAFVVFAVSKSIRVGRVPDEELVSPIAGSELVEARGGLMRRARHAPTAGWLLLLQLHRDLCREYRIDQTAPLADLDAAVAARAGTTPGTVEALLREQVQSDDGLLSLSRRIDTVRRHTLGDAVAASTSNSDRTMEGIPT